MCARVSDVDSLVCREQVCALFIHLFNCFLPFLAPYSVPGGYLRVGSIGAVSNGQVLHGLIE